MMQDDVQLPKSSSPFSQEVGLYPIKSHLSVVVNNLWPELAQCFSESGSVHEALHRLTCHLSFKIFGGLKNAK